MTLRDRIEAVHDNSNADLRAQLQGIKAVALTARRLATQSVRPAPLPPDPTDADSVTPEWLASVIAAQDDQARHRREQTILHDLANRAETQAIELPRWAAKDSTVLPLYDDLLDEIMDQARELAPTLVGVHHAEDAFKYGKTDAWSAAVELTHDYQLLRRHQQAAQTVERIAPQFDRVDDDVDDRRIRNLDELWPNWWRFDRHPTRGIIAAIRGEQPRLEPWPSNPVSRLLWFARNPRWELWVPTDAEVVSVRNARRARPSVQKTIDAPTPTEPKYVDASNPNLKYSPTAIDVTPTLSPSEYRALMGQT